MPPRALTAQVIPKRVCRRGSVPRPISFAPIGLGISCFFPQLTPWAAFLRRFAAKRPALPRLGDNSAVLYKQRLRAQSEFFRSMLEIGQQRQHALPGFFVR
jgi:hypothetical protein